MEPVGGSVGTGAGPDLRRGSPPGPGRGIQAFSKRKPGRKESRGVAPRPPFFMARSFPLARFGVVGRSGTVVGLFRHPCMCPDLEPFFRKNAFQHIFPENASQIGFRIPLVIAPRPYQSQQSPNQRVGTSGHETGVQGRSPGPLSPHFSGEMGTPAGQAGPPGRCAPRVLRSRPPQGYAGPGCPRPPGLGAARSHSLIFGIVVSGTAESLLLPVS